MQNSPAGEGLREIFGNTQLKSGDVSSNVARRPDTHPLHIPAISLWFPYHRDQTKFVTSQATDRQVPCALYTVMSYEVKNVSPTLLTKLYKRVTCTTLFELYTTSLSNIITSISLI